MSVLIRVVVEPYTAENCRLRANGKTPNFAHIDGFGATYVEAYAHALRNAADAFGFTEVATSTQPCTCLHSSGIDPLSVLPKSVCELCHGSGTMTIQEMEPNYGVIRSLS